MVEDVTVVIEGGQVAFAGPRKELGVVWSVEAEARTASGAPFPPEPDEQIDVDGFVMPAGADRHVHIAMSDPRAVVLGGVTAARDLGWPEDEIFSLAQASEAPSFIGPVIQAAGPMITCVGGYPSRAAWAPSGTALEVRGAEEAAEAARRLLDLGARVVKVALNSDAGPTLTDAEIVAVCHAAHAAGAPVTCHAQGKDQVERAVGAGVDELAHCPWSERLNDGLIAAMAKRVRVVSTLDIHSYGRDTPELRTAIENLARFLQAGGTVVYGTDLGNGPIPAGIHVREVRHLYRAGLGPESVLVALTRRPLATREPGDLICVAGNPLEDVDALGDVRLVVRGGRRVA